MTTYWMVPVGFLSSQSLASVSVNAMPPGLDESFMPTFCIRVPVTRFSSSSSPPSDLATMWERL